MGNYFCLVYDNFAALSVETVEIVNNRARYKSYVLRDIGALLTRRPLIKFYK
jgi:hypothetical protein